VSGFDTTFAQIAEVEGWLSEAQARRLWDAASAVAPGGQVVEIGSFRGRSTAILASAAGLGVTVVAVDPHAGGDRGPQEIADDAELGHRDNAAFNANLDRAGVRERVRHVRLPSDEAHADVPGPIDMLYVDGAHRYRPASRDIAGWGARVTPDGVMLIHDSFNAIGVMLAQLRLLLLSPHWRYAGRTGSLAEYRRARLAPGARCVNAARQLAGVPYFARNMAIKVLIVARLGFLTRLLGHDGSGWPY
jgi:hypothetical protein